MHSLCIIYITPSLRRELLSVLRHLAFASSSIKWHLISYFLFLFVVIRLQIPAIYSVSPIKYPYWKSGDMFRLCIRYDCEFSCNRFYFLLIIDFHALSIAKYCFYCVITDLICARVLISNSNFVRFFSDTKFLSLFEFLLFVRNGR